jgi:hypothetical protein
MKHPPVHYSTLPSRFTNPFATCWTRPGALKFQFVDGESSERLLARLAASKWRGEIIGPHGSGKSTLVETLKPRLADAGFSVAAVTLRDGERCLPAGFLRRALTAVRPLVIVDGFEQLSWLSRQRLRFRIRRAAAGLVVTSHAPTGLPTLFQTQPDLSLARQLVSTLTEENFSSVSAADVAASHACHGSNFRELLFTLYDRHETLARSAQTSVCSPA